MEQLKINVYLTTRDNPIKDLDSVENLTGLKEWKKEARQHAIRTFRHNKIDELLIKDLKNYAIVECYAIIAYSGEELTEANRNGKELLQFLKKNSSKLNWDLEETGKSKVSVEEILSEHRFIDGSHFWDNFTYALIHDKELQPKQYEIDLEYVVKPLKKK